VDNRIILVIHNLDAGACAEKLSQEECTAIAKKGGGTVLGIMAATLSRPDYARVTREVRRIHEEFGITTPPVDPVRIARGLGVTVYFVTFENDKKNVSGFFDCEERAIFVNKEEWPLRQTFTIAHELGHKVLHEEWAKSSEYRVLLRDQDYSGDEPHEKEANAFAAQLLVPRFMLDEYWKSLTVEQLSQLFAVSVPMIRNRIAFEYGAK
jgi:Zn-dependent peptidase ImmA (M78 family)